MHHSRRPQDRRAGPGLISLASRLRDSGALTKAWERAFMLTDRAAFVPFHAWAGADDALPPRPVEFGTDAWRSAVCSDAEIVAQFDGGRASWPDVGHRATAFAPKPSTVLRVLGSADLQPRHSVLVIGAGTGYAAALVGAHLGDESVTTVVADVNARRTRSALRATGHDRIAVVTGDGSAGAPVRAPYDRIVATAGVAAGHVPAEWLRQTRPGGAIVTPWAPGFHCSGLLRLDVGDDGTAHGRIAADAVGPRLRHRPLPPGNAQQLAHLAETDAAATESTTWADPREIGENPNAVMAIGLHLPGVHLTVRARTAHRWEVILCDVATGSASICYVAPESGRRRYHQVRQYGPRQLWEDAATAWRWWQRADRPDRQRYGVTVDHAGQRCWLDDPSNPLPTLFEPETGGLR
ncbi:protein-L-isoaspartate O-methyltransferase family protein [Amycolatopsis sp. WGS_07]|uniref:protein-L-isoaspartate O-methyltransferase family protein n=1 Tax=Amycolatopsis sp. WGS_07 TaxID=3076764 RepID=UPI0038735AB1